MQMTGIDASEFGEQIFERLLVVQSAWNEFEAKERQRA